jgi:hypothetical protein
MAMCHSLPGNPSETQLPYGNGRSKATVARPTQDPQRDNCIPERERFSVGTWQGEQADFNR